MKQLKKTESVVRKLIENNHISKAPVWLGNLHTGQKAADNNGNIYVTFQDSGDVITVYNDLAPLILGLQVIIGYEKSNPNLLRVIEVRDGGSTKPYLNLPNHSNTQQWPNYDTLFVRKEQFLPGLTVPVPGELSVKVFGDDYYLDESWLDYKTQILDLSGEIPVSGANWVLVEIDAAGVITFTAGGTVANRGALVKSGIPAVTSGNYPIAILKVYYGQTEFIKNQFDTDILDPRFAFRGSGGELPTFDGLRMVFTDSGGVLDVFDDFIYDPAKNTFGQGGSFPITLLQNDNYQIGDGDSVGRSQAVYSDDVADSPFDMTVRAGGTRASPTAVLNGMVLRRWRVRGYYSPSDISVTQAEIRAVAVGDWDGSNHAVELQLWTTPSGSATAAHIATFKDDGSLDMKSHKIVNVTDPTSAQHAATKAYVDSLVLSDEYIQDLIGAMVSGNTETGIAVTYDDSGGKLNFDAQTAGDARYAPIAKGVTNGDSHDHSGGDGGTIAYSSLSGRPTAEINANDIFRCNAPGGVSAFVGTIATLPGGANLTYNVSSGNEGAMVPFSTSQIAKMRIYNTTRNTSALISNCNTGTNTLTLTASVPAGWQVGDTITIASQTVSGGGFSWVDLEIVSGITGRTNVFMVMFASTGTIGATVHIHPFETYSASKVKSLITQVANQSLFAFALVPVISNVIAFHWDGTWTGGSDFCGIREQGYLE